MIIDNIDWKEQFQTPIHVCEYMSSFLPENAGLILEPTAGQGNLKRTLEQYGTIVDPTDFYAMKKSKFD